MLVAGDAGERRAGLALAARAHHHQLVARQIGEVVLVDEGRQVGQVAGLAGGGVDPPERAADQPDLAIMPGGDLGDGLQPGDVAGKAGDGDTLLALADQPVERRADIGLRARLAFDQRVGRIADHGEHALGADPAQRRLVGDRPDQRIGIELPVAGVEHGAERRAHDDGVGLGNRMGERDQLDLERPDGKSPGQRDLGDRRLWLKPASISLRRTSAAVNGVA